MIEEFYLHYGSQTRYDTIPEAGHCLVCGNEPAACEFELCQMPLHFSIKLLNVCMQPTENYGNACSLTLSPFINDCDYSGAYSALNWLYNGTLMEPDDGIAPTEVRHQTIRTFVSYQKISASTENNGQMF